MYVARLGGLLLLLLSREGLYAGTGLANVQVLENLHVASAVSIDSDRDGVVDENDFCPNDRPESLFAGVSANGCPMQSDGDGTPDWRDRCPETPLGTPTDRYGCPKNGRNLPDEARRGIWHVF